MEEVERKGRKREEGRKEAARNPASGIHVHINLTSTSIHSIPFHAIEPNSSSHQHVVATLQSNTADCPPLTLSTASRSARSSLRGQAGYDGTLASNLALDLDLADFSPALQGRVRGPLALAPGQPFDEALELSGIKPAGADWTLGVMEPD